MDIYEEIKQKPISFCSHSETQEYIQPKPASLRSASHRPSSATELDVSNGPEVGAEEQVELELELESVDVPDLDVGKTKSIWTVIASKHD